MTKEQILQDANEGTKGPSLSTAGLATVYLDEIGNLVVVGYAAYRKTAYVDEGRAIPDSWRRLVVANG